MGGERTGLRFAANPPGRVRDSRRSSLVRLMIVESNLSLLDQSRPLESIIKDFKLLDSKVSIHIDYDPLDSNASGRKTGHVGTYLSLNVSRKAMIRSHCY